MLNTVHYDGPDATPLLIAHGLFGSARNWNVIAKRLSATRHVVVVDMRNHGASPWFDAHSYGELAADLAEVIDQPMDVLGHSMGGKAAMVLASEVPAVKSTAWSWRILRRLLIRTPKWGRLRRCGGWT